MACLFCNDIFYFIKIVECLLCTLCDDWNSGSFYHRLLPVLLCAHRHEHVLNGDTIESCIQFRTQNLSSYILQVKYEWTKTNSYM